jgi:hypothetical protein
MGRAPRSARRSREKITVEKLCSSVRDVITGRQNARGVLSAGNDYFFFAVFLVAFLATLTAFLATFFTAVFLTLAALAGLAALVFFATGIECSPWVNDYCEEHTHHFNKPQIIFAQTQQMRFTVSFNLLWSSSVVVMLVSVVMCVR